MSENIRGTQILAYITGERERVISGTALGLYEQDEHLKECLSVDLAKAMKCDVVQLKNKDYVLIQSR